MNASPSQNFYLLVQAHALQAMLACGVVVPDEKTAKHDLELAKLEISFLEVLQEKTRGNLSREEEVFLADALHECRMAFVRATEDAKKSHDASHTQSDSTVQHPSTEPAASCSDAAGDNPTDHSEIVKGESLS